MSPIPTSPPSEDSSDCLQTPNQIQTMFGRIASRYDFFNRFLSLGQDIRWRKHLVQAAICENPAIILDLATGTGDVLQALHYASIPYGGMAWGVDFSQPMLEQAKKKGLSNLCLANVMELPCRDHSVDVITIAFGLRNLDDRKKFFLEALRVLKDTGKLLILEFSQPVRLLAPFYFFYLNQILPRFANLLGADTEAYRYLSESISQFPNKLELNQELSEAGFERISVRSYCFGGVAFHEAYPPGRVTAAG
ncbi:MAG: ubiquinone/menaquinone biosynthesis methyltransferase [Verrucomicrobiae bacterium]|nr:ubiquinone/menaquinone biosynthesis methyltransferase [Verrucomicrobiae bacterium]